MAKKASKSTKKTSAKTAKAAASTKRKRSTATPKNGVAKTATKNGSDRPVAAKSSSTRKKRAGTSSRTPARPTSKRAPKTAAKTAAAARPASTPVADDARERDSNGRLSEAELKKVKTGLTKKDLAEFRAMLLEKRAELLGDVQGMEAARAEGSSEHLSPEHMADMGSDAFDQEFTLGLMESERRLLHDIYEALERIENGTFGVCVSSGLPIPRARLEIKPWARYTIEVVREREKRGLLV